MANHKMVNVLLKDGTTGQLDLDSLYGNGVEDFIGEVVQITTQDENGMKIYAEGVLVEVF